MPAATPAIMRFSRLRLSGGRAVRETAVVAARERASRRSPMRPWAARSTFDCAIGRHGGTRRYTGTIGDDPEAPAPSSSGKSPMVTGPGAVEDERHDDRTRPAHHRSGTPRDRRPATAPPVHGPGHRRRRGWHCRLPQRRPAPRSRRIRGADDLWRRGPLHLPRGVAPGPGRGERRIGPRGGVEPGRPARRLDEPLGLARARRRRRDLLHSAAELSVRVLPVLHRPALRAGAHRHRRRDHVHAPQ